jgi:dinuclear metal center YbgI/SA1388 family protein
MTRRDDICAFLDQTLRIHDIRDISINGLQVQGRDEVTRVAVATDACLEVYRRARRARADLLVVHHGIIWGGLDRITGRVRDHLAFLLRDDMSLYAAHLPLDAHERYGNNARLSDLVGLQDRERFGTYHGISLGFCGRLPAAMQRDELASFWREELGGETFVLPFGPTTIRTVGIVSGGGSSTLSEAIERGLDCLVTGEGKHEDYHEALEGGMNVIFARHYYTETLGVRALAELLEETFDLETTFIDVPTSF